MLAPSPAPPAGRLILMPNALDGGSGADLRDVLSRPCLELAAALPHWAVENAKAARAFLKRVDAVVPLAQPLQSLDIVELPRARKGAANGGGDSAALDGLLAPARAGRDIGLLSDAGLPGVADPGAALVARAHAAGLAVLALPGPNSLVMALAASGLNGQSFAFQGYLPVDAVVRDARLRELEVQSRRLGQTQIAIETPYRNAALLSALMGTLAPATRLSVSCGLTLPAGWSRTATIAQWRSAPRDLPADVPAVFLFLAS